MSKFDLDSTPPVAIIRPSGLKAIDVTLRPTVPAESAPMVLVIISEISFMFGIAAAMAFGFLMLAIFGRLPMFVSRLIGEVVKSRILLPEFTSHNDTWHMCSIVQIVRPSELKRASIVLVPAFKVRTSRPDLTSQIFMVLVGTDRPAVIWSGRGL